MSSRDKILKYIQEKEQATVIELINEFQLTRAMVQRHLKKLIEEKSVLKRGSPPRVYYFPSENKKEFVDVKIEIDQQKRDIIEKNFLYIMPNGEKADGLNGFRIWCDKRDFDISKKAVEYCDIYDKYKQYKENNLIKGTVKMHKVFNTKCINDVFYSEFYAWEIFGKTKIGQLVMYSKQSQDRKMIKKVVEMIKDDVLSIIKKENIQAIGFAPPSIDRKIQFMRILQDELNIALPVINIVKVHGEIVVPQKTLSKIDDRIKNAKETMVVDDKGEYDNILIIDDAVGSGATLEQLACKCKRNNVAQNVFGYAIVGSVKGFDVISEI
ncbi:MAG: ArsR family transcriptional regulator [Candidatus Moraniibacteriota bacterium]|jgi:Bacterial regulatory protein, arsR family